MNWLDKQIWKSCFAPTFLCLMGCSLGTIGTLFYLADYYWLYAFLISFLTGLLTSILLIAFWNIVVRQINFKEAMKRSFKMSLVPMLIIVGAENLIMLLTQTNLKMYGNYSDNLLVMFIAMSVGFIFALPYNYYILTKTGNVCH